MAKRLTYALACDLLARPDHRLVKMHVNEMGQKQQWFVMPFGPCGDELAEKLLRHPNIRIVDEGLLPGQPQSWKLGQWRG